MVKCSLLGPEMVYNAITTGSIFPSVVVFGYEQQYKLKLSLTSIRLTDYIGLESIYFSVWFLHLCNSG